ncbi:MAG: hypothetical protein KF724_13290 [Phycisphaeraceae bacterium]|nr:hypothetical protein [Phycisphaeraceae bacterium]
MTLSCCQRQLARETDPFVSSSIFSNDLLLKIIYPPGEGSSTLATRTVFYGYNRQGEIVAMVDQNETLHEYERDALGRMTRDTATATASNIDATIDRIDLSFDSAGRLSKVTSLESAGPTVRNEVEFGYTPLGQVEKVYQHSKGAVSYDGGGLPTGDTRLVGYEYANAEIGSSSTGNFSRQTGLAYPRKVNSSGHDPEVLEYAFGTSGGTDDRISRVNQFKFNLTSSTNTSMVNYAFVGVGRTILVDLDQPDVQLDFTLSLDGKRRTVGYTTQTQGFYPGFDQFGRLALQTWADGGLTSASSLPTKPQIVALQYGYDDRGNRTAVLDVRRGNLWNRSHTYTNDGLDRLKKARRNTWANLISGSPVDGVGTQSWDLDLLGNWNEFQSWAPGSPPAPETETRTHNAVNELLTRTLPNSGPEHTLGYDAAGNMATDAVTSGNTTIYTHDAWNRLVKVEVDDGTTVVTKLEQEFNGLTWRTLKREDTNLDGTLDEERVFAYSASWQLLEERVDKEYISSPGLNKRVQYVWGLRYIDDCLMHRADLNNDGDYTDSNENTWYHMTDGMFSSVAVLNRTATLVERVSYDSYGQARHHRPGDVNGDGNSGFTDSALVGNIIVANGGTPVPITSSLYRAEADLNRDGTINSSDRTLAGVSASSLASGLISNSGTGGPDNSIGWDGYVFNPATGDYISRYRTYLTQVGRWDRRDPVSIYIVGSLYEAMASDTTRLLDPMGLCSICPDCDHPTPPIKDFNCAGFAFKCYENLHETPARERLKLANGRELASCNDRCDPGQTKCWMWAVSVQVCQKLQLLHGGEVVTVCFKCVPHSTTYHVVCGQSGPDGSDPAGCPSKWGEAPIDTDPEGNPVLKPGREWGTRPDEHLDEQCVRFIFGQPICTCSDGSLLCKKEKDLPPTHIPDPTNPRQRKRNPDRPLYIPEPLPVPGARP